MAVSSDLIGSSIPLPTLLRLSLRYSVSTLLVAVYTNYLRYTAAVPILHTLHLVHQQAKSAQAPEHHLHTTRHQDQVQVAAHVTQLEFVTLILASALWTRWIVLEHHVPREAGVRLLFGALGLGILGAIEYCWAMLKYDNPLEGWDFADIGGPEARFVAVGALIMVMPVLLMAFEAKENVSKESAKKTQ